MRIILSAMTVLALGGSLSACKPAATPAANNDAEMVAPADNMAIDANGDATAANEAVDANVDMNAPATDQGSTDHGSTDH